MTEPRSTELLAAQCAALSAGRYLAAHRHEPQEHGAAARRDVKLRADRESEAIALDVLSRLAPHPVLAEESGATGDLEENRPIWIVDPLDGTVNYSRELDFCCVSIALYRGWTPLLGVVYDFTRNELFSGVVGQGAWCNGRPIQPGSVEDPAGAILATGFPVNRNFDAEPLQAFLRRVQNFKKIRLLGSAALSLAYTACGRVDAYLEEDIMLYDVAAGAALVLAAGGHVDITPTGRKKWSTLTRAAAAEKLFDPAQE